MDLCKICSEGSGKCLKGTDSYSLTASETIMRSPGNFHAGEMEHCIWTSSGQRKQTVISELSPKSEVPRRDGQACQTMTQGVQGARLDSVDSIVLWGVVKDESLWHLSSPQEYSKGQLKS